MFFIQVGTEVRMVVLVLNKDECSIQLSIFLKVYVSLTVKESNELVIHNEVSL